MKEMWSRDVSNAQPEGLGSILCFLLVHGTDPHVDIGCEAGIHQMSLKQDGETEFLKPDETPLRSLRVENGAAALSL
jgi:hypothetical protein